MIVTNNEEIAEKAQSLKDLAFSKDRRFLHTDPGFNYRMTNIQAAIGLAQFERIDELVEMRRRNAHLYKDYLKDVEGVKLPVEKEWVKNVYWMYGILIEEAFGMSRDELMIGGENYPVAEELAIKGLYLPSSSGLKEEEIKKVVERIGELQRGVV